jgi:hypothetical protein
MNGLIGTLKKPACEGTSSEPTIQFETESRGLERADTQNSGRYND